MLNFTFCNPTRVHFGKDQIAKIDAEVPKDARVLVTFGGGSVKQNGTYDEVLKALGSRTVFEFWGIEPNPTYETLMKAVDLARREKVDFLLAVGGGSVIDGTKFLSAAIPFEGEPWDIIGVHAPFSKVVPLGAVLTLPATGSEMNCASVVTRKETHDKLSVINPLLYPRFSVLDPTKTYSLPAKQVANGVVDAFVHIAEQYFTYPVNSPIQDRFAEGLMLTLIEEGPKALKEPENYEVRANVMWAATMALNYLIGSGVPGDWSTHAIGHELTEIHGIDHGRTLAIVLPAMWKVRRAEKGAKIAQYGRRVLGLTGSDDEVIDQAIAKTEAFFQSVGVPTRMSDYSLGAEHIPALTAQLERHCVTRFGKVALGEKHDITLPIVTKILETAL